MPDATTVKVSVSPEVKVCGDGGVTMMGGCKTVRAAWAVIAPEAFVTSNSYSPDWATAMLDKERELFVALGRGTPLKLHWYEIGVWPPIEVANWTSWPGTASIEARGSSRAGAFISANVANH